MSETFASKNKESILVNKSEAQLRDWIDELTLSVGGDTAKAGMWVTSEGEVTAATPGTHKDIDLAAAYNAANDAGLRPRGVILRPKILPDGYKIDDTITDGTVVLVLRTGAPAIIRTWYTDASDDVLPGQVLCLDSGGMLKKLALTSATTTMTNAEIIAAFGQLSEAVLMVTSVAEDVADTNLIVEGQML